jgi:hypothetical protein
MHPDRLVLLHLHGSEVTAPPQAENTTSTSANTNHVPHIANADAPPTKPTLKKHAPNTTLTNQHADNTNPRNTNKDRSD